MMHASIGKKARDIVTGHVGIITARCEHSNGTVHYLVVAKAGRDRKIPDPQWVDSNRTEIIGDGVCLFSPPPVEPEIP